MSRNRKNLNYFNSNLFLNPQNVTIRGNKRNVPKNYKNIFSNVPVVFETKKQYVNQLINNQEKIKGIHFTTSQKQTFRTNELCKMKNVVARYTTRNNPYMPRETVFFTDRKISPQRLNVMAQHENQHFAFEPFEGKGSKNMAIFYHGTSPERATKIYEEQSLREGSITKNRKHAETWSVAHANPYTKEATLLKIDTKEDLKGDLDPDIVHIGKKYGEPELTPDKINSIEVIRSTMPIERIRRARETHHYFSEGKTKMDYDLPEDDSLESDTNSQNMAWKRGMDAENIPLAKGDYGENYNNEPAYVKKRVVMNADEFLQRQYDQRGNKSSNDAFEDWRSDADREVVEKYKRELQNPKEEVAVPIEVYDRETGKRENLQEGRHRGIAAKEIGMSVPVIMARKKYPPWDRTSVEKPFNTEKYYNPKKTILEEDTEWEKETNSYPEDKS